MRGRGVRIALTGAGIVVVGAVLVLFGVAVAAFLLFQPTPTPQPEPVGRVSPDQLAPDQLAVLAIDGPPQAFTLYFDPQSGSVLEEWSYFTLGREILFLDGSYQGGLEVPLPEIVAGASIPDPASYPWEILQEATPACVVKLAGPALFRTSALVLPGWNDGYQVARLWTLAGGGSMITVDGRLALVSIDPGEAIDLDQLGVSGLFVGTLGSGDNRMGAILSPGDRAGTYRLSLSPRGQGTTHDGTEVILDLEGTRLDRTYVLGTDARASVVERDGSEEPAQASGQVIISRRGDAYEVRVDGRVNDYHYSISGMMGSGLWRSTDPSLQQVLGESAPLVVRRTPTLPPAASATHIPSTSTPPPAPRTETPATITISPTRESVVAEPEAPSGWPLILHEAFDSNVNQWPTGAWVADLARYSSEFEQGRYEVRAELQEGQRSASIRHTIGVDVGPRFHISVEVTQQEAMADQACGLAITTAGGADPILFLVSGADAKFTVRRHYRGSWHSAGWAASSRIRPGQVNRLSVLGDGSQLTFYVNGHVVGVPIDIEDFDVRRVGVVAHVGSSDPVRCSCDNLKVRVER